MDDYLKKNDIEFKNVMYTSNLPAIIELVSVGYGVSFMFEPHLRHRLSNHQSIVIALVNLVLPPICCSLPKRKLSSFMQGILLSLSGGLSDAQI